MKVDVAIVGGGPAGLAVAMEAALRGVSACVLEQRAGPVDKACGEGLMPPGLAALERLGVRPLVEPREAAPFESITYVQENGRRVTGRLPAPGGLGIRRTALAAAMLRRARELGVVVRERCRVLGHRITADGVTLATSDGVLRASLLVAADGLHSPLRRARGLELPAEGPRRFGLRRHAAIAPWSRSVEVHFTDGAEAYVTPAGAHRVGLAFLWEDGRVASPVSFDALLERFPVLRERLDGAAWDSVPRGAGPLQQRVSARAADRFVLVGDAAGYVDAITGEGLSLAFEGAAILGEALPGILAGGAARSTFATYEHRLAAAFARSARLARLLLWTARRPRLRRFVIDRLADAPWLFERALRLAAGHAPSHALPPSPTPARLTGTG